MLESPKRLIFKETKSDESFPKLSRNGSAAAGGDEEGEEEEEEEEETAAAEAAKFAGGNGR